MNSRFLKLVVGGILLGAAVFFVPFFLLKVASIFLIFGIIMWIFKGRRHSHRHRWGGFADKIRSMSDEEYAAFKTADHRCGSWRNELKTEKVQS